MGPLEAAFDRLHDPDAWDSTLPDTLNRLLAEHGDPTGQEVGGDLSVDAVRVFPGGLRVRGDFVFSSHVLVLGTLDVDGVIVGEPEHAILMVAGDVRARAMCFLRSYLCITGSLACSEFLVGMSDGFARVQGRTAAPLFLQEHWEQLSFVGDSEVPVEARFRMDLRSAGYRKSYPRAWATDLPGSFLRPEVLAACRVDEAGDDWGLDPFKLLEFVQSGGTLGLR